MNLVFEKEEYNKSSFSIIEDESRWKGCWNWYGGKEESVRGEVVEKEFVKGENEE
jgi:hypothetical protein